MLHQLKNLGLSEKEARVYLAMLELGPATMLQIAAKAEINRPTAYVQIESLKKLGLVSTQTRGKKQIFMAENPEQLSSLLQRETRAIQTKKEELAAILPDLTTLFLLASQKPQVRFFEGREGLLRMKEEFLRAKKKEILALSPIDDVFKVFPDHSSTYTPRRVAKKIHAKLIYTSEQGELFKKNNPHILSQTRFMKPHQLPLSVDITIFDDCVAVSALRGTISGTIIQHPEIAHSFRGIFHLLWTIADTL